MGPGRWGSRGDIKLGVPVKYGDINNTSLLVEIAKEKGEYTPELSFGTHFFQDLVEAEIKYLPLYPDQSKNTFNEDMLLYQENQLCRLLDDYKEYENVVRVIKTSTFPSSEIFVSYMSPSSYIFTGISGSNTFLYTLITFSSSIFISSLVIYYCFNDLRTNAWA